MSKEKEICLQLLVPEADGPGYNRTMITLSELAEMLPGCKCKPAEAAPAEAAPAPAPKKKKKATKKKE